MITQAPTRSHAYDFTITYPVFLPKEPNPPPFQSTSWILANVSIIAQKYLNLSLESTSDKEGSLKIRPSTKDMRYQGVPMTLWGPLGEKRRRRGEKMLSPFKSMYQIAAVNVQEAHDITLCLRKDDRQLGLVPWSLQQTDMQYIQTTMNALDCATSSSIHPSLVIGSRITL